MADKPTLKLPKTMAACADLLYKTREERYKLQREVKKLEDLESALENHFIDHLPKSEATGVAGKVARVQLGKKVVPVAEDWDAIYKFIRKTDSFELMQRRLNAGAVMERAEAGKPVPGVGNFTAITVSVTKV